MTRHALLDTLDRWIARGWLSRLNRAFVRFLLDLEPDASTEVLWAGALVSHQLDRGEVYLDLARLCQQPGATLAIPGIDAWIGDVVAARAELSALSAYRLEHWQRALRQSALVAEGEGDTPLVLDRARLYLRRYWRYQQTLDHCIALRLPPLREQLPATLRTQLHDFFPDAAASGQDDWQKIACALALRARFTIITGGPGTGKTTTLTKLLALLIQLLRDETGGARKPNILLAAPTGKASARVSESIGKALERPEIPEGIKPYIPNQASTLHRLLGRRHDSRRFVHDRHNPLAADVVIVDEASMIDLEMMAALLDALPDSAHLILLGDKDQLASVEAGSVLGDLCAGAERAAYDEDARAWIGRYAGANLAPPPSPGSAINQQTVMLRHSHRFGEHSGIGRLARAVNAGDSAAARALLQEEQHPDLLPEPLADYRKLRADPQADAADRLLKKLVALDSVAREDKAGIQHGYGHYLNVIREHKPRDRDDFDAWAGQVLAAFDAFQVLAAPRRGHWGVEALNQRIEAWLFPKPAPGLWYEGRPVMVTRNDYNLGLMNGDVGIALYDHAGKLRVAFPSDDPLSSARIRWLSPMRLSDVETAFAITVHKSQGSEFNHVVLALPENPSPVLTRELIYTGITRAKTQFTLLESRSGVLASAVAASMQG